MDTKLLDASQLWLAARRRRSEKIHSVCKFSPFSRHFKNWKCVRQLLWCHASKQCNWRYAFMHALDVMHLMYGYDVMHLTLCIMHAFDAKPSRMYSISHSTQCISCHEFDAVFDVLQFDAMHLCMHFTSCIWRIHLMHAFDARIMIARWC